MRFRALAYLAGNTIVHRCDARVKVLALLLFSIAIFFVRSWWTMAAFAIIVCAAIIVARIPLGHVLRMLAPVFVLAVFSVLFNVLANPGVDGLSAGLFFGVRMLVLIAASFVVCLTTTSNELLHAFRWFIGPLRAIHVPVDDIAFTLALSLRFIPVIEREFYVVRAAQRSRGAELPRPFTGKLHMWGAAFSAVFVGMFRHADALAVAMDARCYGAACTGIQPAKREEGIVEGAR